MIYWFIYDQKQSQLVNISALLFLTLTSVLSTSLLAADQDFLNLGFAQVSSDEGDWYFCVIDVEEKRIVKVEISKRVPQTDNPPKA
jgi:hypothetical protein